MENLERVVEERNFAYKELETGRGDVPGQWEMSPFGVMRYQKFREHAIPPWANEAHKAFSRIPRHGPNTWKFISRFREQALRNKVRERRREFKHMQKLKKLFPNADID